MLEEQEALLNDEEVKVKKKSKVNDIIGLALEMSSTFSEFSGHISDILLCYTVYYTGMAHPGNHSYKIVTVLIFTLLTSVYLIAYSSVINMLLYKGVYEPQQIKKNSCMQVFLKLIFLSFIGPLYFVIVKLKVKVMSVLAAIALIFTGKKGYLCVRSVFLGFI